MRRGVGNASRPRELLWASWPVHLGPYGSGSGAEGAGELGSCSDGDAEAGARVDEHDALRRVDEGEEGEEAEVGRRTSQPSGQLTT